MTISIILEVKDTSLNKHLQKGFSGVRKGESTTPYYVLLIQRPSHWNPSQLKDMHVYQKGPGSDKIWEMKQDDWPKEKRPRRCSHISNSNHLFRDPHQRMYTLVWMGSSACLLSNSVPILLFQSSCKTFFLLEFRIPDDSLNTRIQLIYFKSFRRSFRNSWKQKRNTIIMIMNKK